MRLKPLQQFVCDQCGEVINEPQSGQVEWLQGTEGNAGLQHSFRIVHDFSDSPLRERGGCARPWDWHTFRKDMALSYFLGTDGLAQLAGLLSLGTAMDEFLELLRRLQIPHYEEARLYWSQAQADGFFEGEDVFSRFNQQMLARIIARYESSA